MRGGNAETRLAGSIGIQKQSSRYDKAIAINPHDVRVWNNRGNAFIRLGQRQNALASFDKAIAINPGYTVAKQNREIALKNKPDRT